MPMPPLLPIPDWKSIFDSGKTFDGWLAAAESAERRDKMQTAFQWLTVDPMIEAAISAIPRRVNVVAIAEDWCGDVVRHVPALAKLEAASNGKISVRYITRAQHLDVFGRFLTNGGEAIPKFILLSENWVECGNWGPMPMRLRDLIPRGKACNDVASARKKVSALYAADPNLEEVVDELFALIRIASTIRV